MLSIKLVQGYMQLGETAVMLSSVYASGLREQEVGLVVDGNASDCWG